MSEDPLARLSAQGGGAGQGGAGASGTADSGEMASNSGAAGAASNASLGLACRDPADCGNNLVCTPDVEGTRRCCEAHCASVGWECAPSGVCRCDALRREVDGRCLLDEGQSCSDDAQCASTQCVDGWCCNEACDGVCESCGLSGQLGICSLHLGDDACTGRTDPSGASAGFECTGRDRCRLPLRSSCRSSADCDSDHCAAAEGGSICCASACDGVCQRCGVNSGECDAFPAADEACGTVSCDNTACRSFKAPSLFACADHGVCAGCEPVDLPRVTPCGPGASCDGNGACQFDGVGKIAAGERHTCAIRASGTVICWGANDAGQLGTAFDRAIVGDDERPSDVDLELDFGKPALQLAAGALHTCALLEGGEVRCWGRVLDSLLFGTVAGVLGTDQIGYSSGFVDPLRTGAVRLPGRAIQISAGPLGAHTCAVLEGGRLVCWGYNALGQCGNGTREEVGAAQGHFLPLVPLPEGAAAIEVRASGAHTCVVLADGQLMCWGDGRNGKLGYGDGQDRLLPSGTLDVGAKVLSVAAGRGYTCAVLEQGRVRCWGSNSDGELGYGHDQEIGDDETLTEAALWSELLGGDVPLSAQFGGGGVVQITTAGAETAMCVRYELGTVQCWGDNVGSPVGPDIGILGYGHTQANPDLFTPYELSQRPSNRPGLSRGGAIPLGGNAIALAENGRCALVDHTALGAGLVIQCWGDNRDGQLGLPGVSVSGSLTPEELGAVSWEPSDT